MPPKRKIPSKAADVPLTIPLTTADGGMEEDVMLPTAAPIVRVIRMDHLPAQANDGYESEDALEYVDPPAICSPTMVSPQDVTLAPLALPAEDVVMVPAPQVSVKRALTRQTNASFISAGGSPTPRITKASKKPAKGTADKGKDGIMDLERRMGSLEAAIAGLSKDNKEAAIKHAVVFERINNLTTFLVLRKNPDFKNLHSEHLETRTALNQVSTELSSFISTTSQSLDALNTLVSDLVEAQQDMETRPSLVPPIVTPPSAPTRVNMPPTRSNGFLSSPHPTTGEKRKSREWGSSHPDRAAQIQKTGVEVPTKVSFGPIRTLGDTYTRGIDAVRDADTNPDTVLSVVEAELEGFIIITFRSLDVARHFTTMVEGNCGGKFRNCKVRIIGSAGTSYRTPIQITSWNCNGCLAATIVTKTIRNLITNNDITFFQETLFAPSQHLTVRLPRNFDIVAKSRRWCKGHHVPRGGVAAVIRDSIKYTVCESISHPDLLVLELAHCFIISSYIIPETSKWTSWTDTDPQIRLAEAIDFCSSTPKPFLVLGDLNARTADQQPAHSHLLRASPDPKISTRGRWLIETCETYTLHILNGTSKDSTVGDRWTSFQPKGSTVIDYGIASEGFLEILQKFEVKLVDDEKVDHASLCVRIHDDDETNPDTDGSSGSASNSGLTIDDLMDAIDLSSPIEQVLLATLDSALTEEEACTHLYGPVFFTENPVNVYIGAATRSRWTGLAISLGSRGRAHKWRCEGGLDKGYILAVIQASLKCDPNHPLLIYTASQPLIDALVIKAGRNSLRGWGGKNGEVLKLASLLLARRPASTDFRIMRGGENGLLTNKKGVYVMKAAFEAATDTNLLPTEAPNKHQLPIWPLPNSDLAIKWRVKVSAPASNNVNGAKSRTKAMKNRLYARSDSPPADLELNNPSARRGRAKTRKLLWQNLQMAVRLSTTSMFWKFVKEKMDNKTRTCPVHYEDMADNFKVRMSPPDIIPEQFDEEQFRLDEQLSNNLPKHSVDETEDQFFSNSISAEEVDIGKQHIQKHASSAKGLDGIQYLQILEIPSDKLATLFNTCISSRDAPQIWLKTVLIGILKPGKSSSDPNNYRLIALECCFLKLLTLIIAQRFRTWVAKEDILPEAQNGFRADFRTSNCAFILRAAIDRARAMGKSLIVSFIDLENAFPSTNLSTLWKKLDEAGAKGPLMDWIRMIYECMQYSVASYSKDRRYSDLFLAFWGILAGDSMSPDLFTFFAADCKPPDRPNDLTLFGIVVNFLLLADDMVLIEYWEENAMQDKLDYMFHNWCRRNFLKMNARKTKFMIFGPLPPLLPALKIGDDLVEGVDQFPYVGMIFQSTSRNIFAAHYAKKAALARSGNYSFFMLESVFGTLWPKLGIQLYMARVDPHLTYGCEVAIDVDKASLQLLQKAQVMGLRRILGLGPRSIRVILFTETGIIPIQYRRLILALRYISYILDTPSKRFVHIAWEDSKDLLAAGCPCWIGDIKQALHDLPVPVQMEPIHLVTMEGVNKLIDLVQNSCAKHLWEDVESCSRLPLLHGRLRTGEVPTLRNMVKLCKYLWSITVPAHRLAFTRFLCSAHDLAVERLRHTAKRQPKIPRHMRICRLCHGAIEDEGHVALICQRVPDSILSERQMILSRAATLQPHFDWRIAAGSNGTNTMRALCKVDDLIPGLAAYIYRVLKTFGETEMYIPLQARTGVPLLDPDADSEDE